MKALRFEAPLVRGVIRCRPNRFIMMVEEEISGELKRCHCPVTGNIGYLDFSKGGIPCLLSPASSPRAKTAFTVEAISLEPVEAHNPKWLGINQTKANRYFEYFLSQRMWSEFTPNSNCTVSREVRVGDSRLDFCVDQHTPSPHYIEIKSPMNSMDSSGHPNYDSKRRERAMITPGRLSRHMDALSEIALAHSISGGGPKCSMVLLFMYDAPRFRTDRNIAERHDLTTTQKKNLSKIYDHVDLMNLRGVRIYQLNLSLNATELSVSDFFQLE